MAIMLREEGLLERTILYATDINPHSLDKARQGIFPLDRVSQYTANYQKGGGLAQFSSYYTAAYNGALFDKSLRENMTFATIACRPTACSRKRNSSPAATC